MKKIAAACVAALVVAAGTWWTAARFAESPADSGAAAGASTRTAAALPERKRARAEVTEAVAATRDEELPPPVDLDRCDRDLDLFGVVQDEDGKAVAGARLRTASFPWKAVEMASGNLPRQAEGGPASRTARDGTFALRLRRGEVVDLRVTADGYADVVRADCQAGERVKITLVRGATLEVTTVDEEGRPVDGVHVRARRSRQFDPVKQDRDAVTDAAGRVVFSCLAPGPMRVTCHHATLGDPWLKDAIVPTTGVLTLRVTMPTGRTIRGRVTDAATGGPIVGARVGSYWVHDRNVLTDADGRYTFPGWTGRTSLAIVANGFGALWKRVGDAVEVDFALTAGHSAVGRLVRVDGTPVEGGYVTAVGGGGDDGRYPDVLSARSRSDGRFALAGLQHDAAHTLIAGAPGLGRMLVDFDPPAERRGTVDLGDIVFRVGRAIEGVATDGDGSALPDVTVSLVGANDDRARGRNAGPTSTMLSEQRRTDDLGRFRFADIAPGTYALSLFVVDAPGTPRVPVVLPPDRDVTGVRVSFAGARTITLLVVDDTGAPQAGVDVYAMGKFPLVDGGFSSLSGWTGPDGRVTFRGLPATSTQFFVNNVIAEAKYVRESVGPVVPDGQEIRVTLRRAAMVAGFVKGEDGMPVPHLTVQAVLRSDGSDAGVGFGDDAGAFSLKAPAGEKVDLRVDGSKTVRTKQGSSSVQTDWRGELREVVGPAQGVVVVVRREEPPSGRKLTVVVRDSAGAPAPNLQVRARGVQGGAVTDANGHAQLGGLPAEEVTLVVLSTAGWSPPRELDVPPKPLRVIPNGQEVTMECRAGVALRGRTTGPDRMPFGSFWLNVSAPDEPPYTLLVDHTGCFTVGVLPGVAHKLHGSRRDGDAMVRFSREDVVPGAEEVVITAK